LVDFIDRDTLVFRANLGARISYCSDIIGKKADAAGGAGVTPEQLNKWIKGTVKVPVEALRLLSVTANVDFGWLATGEGVAPPGAPVQVRATDQGSPKAPLKGSPQGAAPRFAYLPLFDIEASAGLGVPVGPEVRLGAVAFDPHFLRAQGARPDQCSIIAASGDSMQPVIPDGSLLVVDHSQKEVRNGHIMVVNVGDDLLVKRIRRRLDGLIELISDNPAYAPETLGPDALQQLRVVGRVVYFCRVP
jgi:phage repressor protein C with HTH and peptisase S24 domain